MPYTCITCGNDHYDLPHLGCNAPDYWRDELEGREDSYLTTDLCVVEGEAFFVRGVIEIPVHDFEHEFGWGVWVSHKKENFEIYRDNFESEDIGPFFGWLCNKIAHFEEDTIELKTMAHYRGEGLRPCIEVGPSEHPLYEMQQNGITLDEAWRIVHSVLDEQGKE